MKKDNGMIMNAAGGVFDCRDDAGFTLLQADASFYDLLGYTKEEFAQEKQNAVAPLIHENERELLLKELHNNQELSIHMFENRLYAKDSSIKWVWISVQRIHDVTQGDYFHCIFHDITENKHAKENLELREKRLDFLLEQTQDIIFEYDSRSHEIFYSENFAKKYGYSIPVTGFPDSMFNGGIVYEEDIAALRNGFQSIAKGKKSMECEYRLRYRDKGYRWVKVSAKGFRDQHGNLMEIMGVITDIHEQKQEVIKSRKEAALDPLTGLYNRRECIRQLDNYIAVEGDIMAFILIDIDDFKQINDTFGHNAGDRALQAVGNALKALTRTGDIVARIGGDEFVVCLLHLPDKEVAIYKVESILNAFSMEVEESLGHSISSSIGVSFYPEQGNDYLSLMENADVAMYQAKTEGKNRYVVQEDKNADRRLLSDARQYMKKNFRDKVVDYLFDILDNGKSGEDIINQLLHLVGGIFQSDRSLIYKKQGETYSLLYEWLSDDFYHLKEKDFPYAKHLTYENHHTKHVLFFANLSELEDDTLKEWFETRQTLAGVIYVKSVEEEDDLIISFEDCHGVRNISGEARYTLMLIAKVMAMVLRKEYKSHKQVS